MAKVVQGYKKQAKEKIMDSASQLFFQLGYSTTMEEIATKIGVTKGTLYLYFKSKDDLLNEVCSRNMNLLRDSLIKMDPKDFFDTGERFFEAELKMPDHIKFHWILAVGEMGTNPRVRQILSDSYKEYCNIIAEKIESLKFSGRILRQTDSLMLARTIIAFHNGLMMSIMQGLSEGDALAIFKMGIRAFLENVYNTEL